LTFKIGIGGVGDVCAMTPLGLKPLQFWFYWSRQCARVVIFNSDDRLRHNSAGGMTFFPKG